jgi:hypothetical protein
MLVNKHTQPIIKRAANDTNSTLPTCLSETEKERQRIDAEYKLIHAKVMAEMQIDHLGSLTTEEEILSVAVSITKRK